MNLVLLVIKLNKIELQMQMGLPKSHMIMEDSKSAGYYFKSQALSQHFTHPY